jgi:hypothetical protein
MPARGHPTAPAFDGNPLNLRHFLEEIQLLADDAGLDEAGRIRHALRYASLSDNELWSGLASAQGNNWADFKTAVTNLYPGADDDRRYGPSDLSRLASRYASYGIQSRAELGEYYREFIRVADYLVRKGRLSDRERNIAYQNGFQPDLRARIQARLQYTQVDHFHDDPYDYNLFHRCAHFLLAGTAASPETHSAPHRGPETYSTPEPARPKQEPTEPSLAELVRTLSQQMVVLTQAITTNHTAQRPVINNNNQQPVGDCSVCSSPDHRARNCPAGEDLIREGKCIRNEAGRLMLPNGSWLPRNVQGRNLREKFEAWHAQNQRTTTRDTPPHMQASTNILRVQPWDEASVFQASIETDDESDGDDEPVDVFTGESSRPKRKVRFDGVEVPTRNNGKDKAKPAAPPAASKPATPLAPSKPAPSGNPTPTAPNRTQVPKPAAPTADSRPASTPAFRPGQSTPPTTQPQYRYQSPIEDPTIAKSIVDRALDTTISLTQRELLAISPDLRRQLKDLTTSKKIPNDVGLQEVLQTMVKPIRVCENCEETIHLVVGEDCLPLRAVYPLISGNHKFESVLDSGSQIIGMREDIWEAIGDPMHDTKMSLQSANNTRDETMGKLRDVRFTFGDLDFYLQIQVVRNAPYEILLGKPFFALTTAVDKHFLNGDQHITLTDPNTGRTVTVPTVEHNVPNRQELSDTGKPSWRARYQPRRNRNIPEPDLSQMYIEIVSAPSGHIEELLLESLDQPYADPEPMDDTPSDSDSDTAIPDIITAQNTILTPNPGTPDTGVKIIFEGDHPEPLQDDEDLVELEFECPPDNPDQVRSLLTLIGDFQEYLENGGEDEDDDEPVEVFEIEAPAPRKDLKGIAHKKRYKKVATRVRPVETETPPEFRIIRNIIGDPLADLPTLPTNPPEFTPGVRYTEERAKKLRINQSGFMWPEEEKLAHHLIREQEMAFAWDESEKGMFNPEYFPPIRVATVPHDPWVHRNIPIPPGILAEVVAIIKDKLQAGTYEPSNSSYRTRWFCALKKDQTSLRIVHDLQPLNAFTIRDAAVPPMTEQMAESFSSASCFTSLDLFVSFDQRLLHPDSRDYTTFQSPLGTLRLTRIPMGWTNSPQIMHGDSNYILKEEIPKVTIPFVDDINAKGPPTRYELPDGGYETIPDNPGIRRFAWEHLNDVNRILQRYRYIGGTFNGKKLSICQPSVIIVGHKCTYEGRIPLEDKVQKVRDWPVPRTATDVRSFLGTCGLMRIFIKDFAMFARPLVQLTRKGVPFRFEDEEFHSFQYLKDAVATSQALRAIDYDHDWEVILAVDSSVIGTGFILMQKRDDNKRYPSRFGSIAWSERESRYSQAKLELYGLFRALRNIRVWIIGVRNLTVEVDAKYIKGMLNNPDFQPNATINRWIAGILLFDFKLVHVPAAQHAAADGLSRRPRAEEDPDEPDDPEDWIDESYGFFMELVHFRPSTQVTHYQILCHICRHIAGRTHPELPHSVLEVLFGATPEPDTEPIPRTEKA